MRVMAGLGDCSPIERARARGGAQSPQRARRLVSRLFIREWLSRETGRQMYTSHCLRYGGDESRE